MVLDCMKKWLHKDELYLINEQVGGYTVKKFLGEGRYGIVYLGQNEKNEQVVIKQLKNNMLRKAKDRIHYEQDTLKKLGKIGDERFPKYLGKFHDNNRQGYILEYKAGKTFEQIIYEEKYVFSKEEIYEIAFQLIDIIKLLYDNQIIHKDIRVANVIFHPIKGISLIDFGLARYITDEKYNADEDYWYLADFLIHLYYTAYKKRNKISRPWYRELDLTKEERQFLKKLMGIDGKYENIYQIENDLENIRINYIE